MAEKLLSQKGRAIDEARRRARIDKELKFNEQLKNLRESPIDIAPSELSASDSKAMRVKGVTEHLDNDRVLQNPEGFKKLQKDLAKKSSMKDAQSVFQRAVDTGDAETIQKFMKSKSATKDILKQLSKGQEGKISKILSKIGKVGKKGLKSVPLIGPVAAAGITSLLDSKEAAADELATGFVPGGLEGIGEGSDMVPSNSKLFKQSPEEKKKILEELRKEALLNKLNK